MALGINIVSGFDSRGIEKAIKEFKKLETTGERAQFMLQKAALPAAAALAGLAAAAGLAVKAAIEDQAEQEKLATTLRNVTGATDDAIRANEEYLASLQRTTTFSDSEMRPALANLVQASGDLSRAQRDLRLAQDIAIATGTPLIAVTDALGKAYNDNFKSLRALSPALNDNIKQGQSLDEIFRELSNTFGGSAANAANTAAGQFTILRNSLAETAESIGAALIPAFTILLAPLRAFADWASRNVPLVTALGVAIGIFAAVIVTLNVVMKTYAVLTAAATAATVAFNASLSAGKIGLIIGGLSALAGGVAFLASKFRSAKDDVKQFYGALNNTEAFTAAGERFINLTNSVLKLNPKLATTTNQLDVQNRRLQALAGQYGVTRFEVGKFERDQKSAGEKVKTAEEKLKELTSALKAQTSAQRAARDAAKDTADAQKELANANEAVTNAQAEFNRVVSGLGRGSKQAADRQADLDRAQRDVERSGYDVEQAVFAVKKAEEELAKVRLDPESNATKIREAEISLAESKLSVADAQDRQRQATVDLNRAQTALDETVNGAKEGTDAYKEALDKLNAAKQAQEDAIDRVNQAHERERDAINDVAEAQKELNALEREYGKLLANRAKMIYDATQAFPTVTVPTAPVGSPLAGNPPISYTEPDFYGGLTVAAPTTEMNVTINAGMGADGQAVARDFIDYLKQYERANGYIPITAQYAAFGY